MAISTYTSAFSVLTLVTVSFKDPNEKPMKNVNEFARGFVEDWPSAAHSTRRPDIRIVSVVLRHTPNESYTESCSHVVCDSYSLKIQPGL